MTTPYPFNSESFVDPKNHVHDPLHHFRTHPYPWEPIHTDERIGIKNHYFKRYNAKPPKKSARLPPHFLDHDTESRKEKYDPPPTPVISEPIALGPDGEWLKWGFVFLILTCTFAFLSFLWTSVVIGLLALVLGQRFEQWLKQDGEEGEWLMTDTWEAKKPGRKFWWA